MLKQNGTILAQYPFRLLGGGIAAGSRAVWGRTDRINQYAGEGITDLLAAVPNGHLAPSAWILPQVSGGMSSRNEAACSITTAGNAAQGINLVSNAILTLSTAGSAAAVAAAIGSATLVLTTSGTAVAPLNVVGSTSAAITAAASVGGIASITGLATAAVTGALVTGGIGHMVSQPISQDLTVDSIAAGVWSAVAASNNTAGTMGNKLNSAASGGVDYGALATAVWEHVTRTLTSGEAPSVEAIAAEVIAEMNATPPAVNIKKVNDVTVSGTGTESNPWNPA